MAERSEGGRKTGKAVQLVIYLLILVTDNLTPQVHSPVPCRGCHVTEDFEQSQVHVASRERLRLHIVSNTHPVHARLPGQQWVLHVLHNPEQLFERGI
jgi:hypothetical protein